MTTDNTSTASTELKRILVIDDEAIVLKALSQTLRAEGYDVVTSDDPLEAIEILQKTEFAVILSDQQMPKISGLEVLAIAKELQPHTTRILITAVLSLNTVIDAINKGEIYRFIVKPWLREELLVTIRNAVQRYHLIHQNNSLRNQAIAMNKDLAEKIERVDEQKRQLEELNDALHKNLEQSVQLCLKTMETFYPVLGSRGRRVLEICRAIAQDLKLPAEQRRVLEISARLHDIGLIGTPREIIRKWQHYPDSLSEAERALIELHPVLGQELLTFVADLGEVGTIVRAHHERFDGEGYPDRLSGDQIPWLARLLSVAVNFAALPYDPSVASTEIARRSGSEFDPDAVRTLLRCLPHADLPRNQRQVTLGELRPGMVLAHGIYTANGLLLIPEGQSLNEPQIEKIQNHNRVNPITQTLMVYC